MKPYSWWQDFYDKWGALLQLLVGALLVATSIIVVILAFTFSSDHSASEREAHVACERAIEFGPPLGAFFERVHVLTVKELADYRSTIPKRC